jgi:FAD/FMN-containing dehydrogenase
MLQRRGFVKVTLGAAAAAAGRGRVWAAPPAEPPAYYVPGDAGYEGARRPYNADIQLKPAIIAACASEPQVSAAIERARAEGLPVAIKSGGHSFEGFSLNDGGMVIELSRATAPRLAKDGTFSAGPGITLGAVSDFLLPKGRLLPAGSCSGVGLGGLALGGGYGLFSRQFGLTCDHLTRVRMLDGRAQLVDSNDDPDLLWACRGGGNGHFGVITEMVFRTVEAPERLATQRFNAGPLSVAETLRKTEAWFAMALALPDPIFSACVVNGKHITILLTSTAPHTGPAFQAASAALRAAGFAAREPLDAPLARAIKRYYGEQSPLPFRNCCGGMADSFAAYAPALPAAFAEVQRAGLILQFNTLGGAIARPLDSAYPHRDRKFLAEIQAYWDNPAQRDPKVQAAASLRRLLGAVVTAHYANYPSTQFPAWQAAYYADNYPRLQALKARYDPTNLFRHPQSVAGA